MYERILTVNILF